VKDRGVVNHTYMLKSRENFVPKYVEVETNQVLDDRGLHCGTEL
jgi:hypothetical protein